MHKIIAILIFLVSSSACANPLVSQLRLVDQSRLCNAETSSKEARLLKRDVGYILESIGMDKDAIVVHIGNCAEYASAATSLNTIIISTDIANLSRKERFYLLAHEIGHLVNNDFKKWTELGEMFSSSPSMYENVDKIMSDTSRKAEFEADIFAAKVLVKMEIDVESATTSYFMKMRLLHLPGTSSHPSASERIATMIATAK